MEAITTRVAIALRLEAIATRMEAITTRVAIALRLEAIATRVVAIAGLCSQVEGRTRRELARSAPLESSSGRVEALRGSAIFGW